jgi:MerR family transcriptional regulator/heat shock protein HspR
LTKKNSDWTTPRYAIGVVAERFGIHPQTLRMYEREGLLEPGRTEGGTRLYSDEDLEQLELILSLTRDLGVNLAGVEIILHMRRRMSRLQQEVQEMFEYLNDYFGSRRSRPDEPEGGLLPRPLSTLLRMGREPADEED